MHRCAPAILIAALAACGPRQETTAEASQPIIGGQLDSTDTAVFLIGMTFNNAVSTACSATLIGSRSLLTAAHCVDPVRQGATSVVIEATNVLNDSTATSNDYQTVTSWQLHPSWDPTANPSPYDAAMLLLPAAPPGTAPEPWNGNPLAGFDGATVRAVGYGRTAAGTADTGTRHQVAVTVTSVASDSFQFGVSGTAGICLGDSGGPGLYTFPDGIERQVGIHSYETSPQCGDGVDVRTDFVAAFIASWLAANDPMTSTDAGCGQACPTSDAGIGADGGDAGPSSTALQGGEGCGCTTGGDPPVCLLTVLIVDRVCRKRRRGVETNRANARQIAQRV